MEEIWKDIEGYENLYQVSNMGNVKSLERYELTNGRVKIRKRKEKILKPHPNGEGYPCVVLSKNSNQKTHRVHRLVAQAFIPNIDNKPCVDHINRNKLDNRVENLRWVTNQENMNNPLTLLHLKDVNKENNKHRQRMVVQLSKKNDFIKLWESTREASRKTQIDNKSICWVCSNKPKYKTAGGYKWQYVEDYLADWWDKEMDKYMEKEKAA